MYVPAPPLALNEHTTQLVSSPVDTCAPAAEMPPPAVANTPSSPSLAMPPRPIRIFPSFQCDPKGMEQQSGKRSSCGKSPDGRAPGRVAAPIPRPYARADGGSTDPVLGR